MHKFISLVGMLVLVGIAFLMSNNKKRISFRILIWGILLQVFFAFIILPNSPLNVFIKSTFNLTVAPGEAFFKAMNGVVIKLLSFTEDGSRFIFGNLVNNNVPVGEGVARANSPVKEIVGRVAVTGAYFAFNVLPTIIFFSSLMAVLYYLGIMQKVVAFFSWIMEKFLRTSGAETLSASANIFVGQTEAPLVVKPFVGEMTMSELMVVMVGGFATVAGGVMAAYVGMLKDYFPNIAGHLISASIMSAPAGIVMAKLMYPETEEPKTKGGVKIKLPKTNVNIIDAAASGAGTGLKLALNVGAMLLAFIALVSMVNFCISSVGNWVNILAGKDPCGIVISKSAHLGETSVKSGDTIIIFDKRGEVGSYRINEDMEGNRIVLETRLEKGFKDKSFKIISSPGEVVLEGTDCASARPGFQLSLEIILGWLFAPLAWVMGVPWRDCLTVGRLLGIKTAVNEFVAYFDLANLLAQGKQLEQRSIVIATYALCGFANFSSIAIQIGGIGSIAPSRRHDLARIGFKAMIGGTLAAFMTGTIAGMFV